MAYRSTSPLPRAARALTLLPFAALAALACDRSSTDDDPAVAVVQQALGADITRPPTTTFPNLGSAVTSWGSVGQLSFELLLCPVNGGCGNPLTRLVASGGGGQQSVTWQVPACHPPGNYITHLQIRGELGTSDGQGSLPFTLGEGTAACLNDVSVGFGSRFVGENQRLFWNATGQRSYRVFLHNNQGPVNTAGKYENGGPDGAIKGCQSPLPAVREVFITMADLPERDYRFRLIIWNGDNCTGHAAERPSGFFLLKQLPTVGAVAVSPTVVDHGQTARITWASTFQERARFDLIDPSGAVVGFIPELIGGGRLLDWTVTTGVAPGNYRVRVSVSRGPSGDFRVVSADSNPFTVRAVQRIFVSFKSADSHPSEGAGSLAPPVVLTTSDGQPTRRAVSVSFGTVNGLATAGSDYTAVSGSLTFAEGTPHNQERPITPVPILEDLLDEPQEDFRINLSNPVGAELGARSTHFVNIQDNDPTITLRLTQVAALVNEGAGSVVPRVSITTEDGQPTRVPVTVSFSAGGGTATPGADYAPIGGTLSFPTGAASGTQQSLPAVSIVNDVLDEDPETFVVTLASAAGGVIGAAQLLVTIDDDDPTPTLTLTGGGPTAEGASNTRAINLSITLSAPSSRVISARLSTVGGTATAADRDFVHREETVTLAAGQTSATFSVQVRGDIKDEDDESFTVTMSALVHADPGTSTTTTVVLTDDDGPPAISVGGSAVREGDGGTAEAVFNVLLSHPSAFPVSVSYVTAEGSATAGSDYTATAAPVTVTFPPGTWWRTIRIPVAGDTAVEGDETFSVALSDPTNGTLASASGTATVFDDEGACTPVVALATMLIEAAGGARTASVTAAAGCAWRTRAIESWLALTSGGSGTGDGTVGFTAAANNSPLNRVGSVSVLGSALRIHQAGTPLEPPAETRALAPTGTVATRRPAFSWVPLYDATDYRLVVALPNGTAVLDQVVSWSACGAEVCSMRPAQLLPGTYTWTVQPLNRLGAGPVSPALTVTVVDPPAPTLVGPSGTARTSRPTYQWTPVAGALEYELFVAVDNDGDINDNPSIIQIWYLAATVCAAGTCAATPERALANMGHGFWVRAKVDDLPTAWSPVMRFLVRDRDTSPPERPTLVSPTGTTAGAAPVFTWNVTDTATDYRLWIDGPGGVKVFEGWFQGATVCSGATCSTPAPLTFAAGTFTWWVMARNGVGTSDWSAAMTFTVPPAPVPGSITKEAPAGSIDTATPTFRWVADPVATSYALWLSPAANTDTAIVNETYTATAVCSGGTCSVTPAVTLTGGAYKWFLRGFNVTGSGPWGPEQSFTVVGLGRPTPLGPSGAAGTNTPTYRWQAVTGAAEYYLWVDRDATGLPVVQTRFPAATICAGGTCATTPASALLGGGYTWWVQARNAGGVDGPWTEAMKFSVP